LSARIIEPGVRKERPDKRAPTKKPASEDAGSEIDER
jgi:hypothetical protein